VDDTVENPGVGTDEEVTARPRRSTREPVRFSDSEHSAVFSQVEDQYQNIEATMPTKQYGMKAGLKYSGKPVWQP